MDLKKYRKKADAPDTAPIAPFADDIFFAIPLRRTHRILNPPIGKSIGYRGDYLIIRSIDLAKSVDPVISLSIMSREDFLAYFEEVKDNEPEAFNGLAYGCRRV